MTVDAKNAFQLLSAGRRHNLRGGTIKNVASGTKKERVYETSFANAGGY